jgi:HprK-related kinase A
VSLVSDAPRFVEDFSGIYGAEQWDCAGSDFAIRMEVRNAGRTRLGRRRYQVFGDGAEVGGWRRPDEVIPFVEWGINLRVMATRGRYLQLHAASLVRDGQGLVVAGESGCGKSTLAAGLLASGWRYLCDEFALIDPETLLLHPFPKPLCIKAGSFAAVRGLGLPFARRRDYIKGLKGKVAYINPYRLGRNAVAEPAPVRFVVFPQYSGDARPRLSPVSRAAAALRLASSAFNPHAFGARRASILTETLRNAGVFELESGDLEETCRLLTSQLGFAPAPGAANTPRKPARPRSIHLEDARRRLDDRPRRRDVLRFGAKLPWVTPSILTLTASHAVAAGSIPSGQCSTAVHTGGLCETDTDCCTSHCDLGICR